MIRCQGFRLEDKASAAFAEERYITRIKNRRHSPLQDNVVSAKLVQCDRIATIKGRYNVQEVEDEKREAKKSDPPLYFDEVVRLLQIHTKIQPSRCLISELEGQELFTYARIAILSEDDVVSVLHGLSLWIVPCDLYEKRQSSADEEQKKSEEAKESPPAASAFPRKRSKIPAAADKDKIQPRDSADEESYIIPRIVAYHDKPKKEDDYWYLPKLPASHTEDLSVLAICSKLKNECIENMEQRNLFENTSL